MLVFLRLIFQSFLFLNGYESPPHKSGNPRHESEEGGVDNNYGEYRSCSVQSDAASKNENEKEGEQKDEIIYQEIKYFLEVERWNKRLRQRDNKTEKEYSEKSFRSHNEARVTLKSRKRVEKATDERRVQRARLDYAFEFLHKSSKNCVYLPNCITDKPKMQQEKNFDGKMIKASSVHWQINIYKI